jgi:hypothetical protein
MAAIRIDEGHFGKVRLDGLKFAGMFAWPKAIHEGHGEGFAVIDEKASPEQREALLKILSGQETDPFATIFSVLSAMTETFHEPVFKPIDFEVDIEERTGRVSIPGIITATTEPIRNPVTGNPHRAKVSLPHGFEYSEAEFASGTVRAIGAVNLDWANRHAHLAMLHLGPNGVIH